MNSALKTLRIVPALTLALVMTLAMLGGIDRLAAPEGASSAGAWARAQGSAPRG